MRCNKKIICLTPVKNEAWILDAFLKATSLWADYIIIADQNSTDGSREIASSYEKVILIDNNRERMHQAETRKLLLNKALEIIDGEKIIFCLDADEFLSGDSFDSESWNIILNSRPGDLFWFKWMNLLPNKKDFYYSSWLYFAANIDDQIINGEFPNNYIHEWRLPYPSHGGKVNYLEDIQFIHFARVNQKRQKNKERFYQVATMLNEPSKSSVSLFRMYNEIYKNKQLFDCFKLSYYLGHGVDLFNEINLDDDGEYYTIQTNGMIKEKGSKYFKYLDIWDENFIDKNDYLDPRTLLIKILHKYLRISNQYRDSLLVKLFDKLLKLMRF